MDVKRVSLCVTLLTGSAMIDQFAQISVLEGKEKGIQLHRDTSVFPQFEGNRIEGFFPQFVAGRTGEPEFLDFPDRPAPDEDFIEKADRVVIGSLHRAQGYPQFLNRLVPFGQGPS